MLNATILSIKEQTDLIRIFRIKMDGGQFEFQPGQFAILELDGVKRAYTIASAPGRDYMDFIIILVPDGQLTPKIWALKIGDKIGITPRAFGHIRLGDIPGDAPLLLIGTGTGIAMMRSIIDSGALKTHKITLLSGARYSADLGWREEMDAIKDPNFSLIQMASREVWNGKQGRLSTVFEDPELSAKLPELNPKTGLHIIICGGPEMVDGMVEKFRALGFLDANAANPFGNLHFEKY